MSVTPSGPVSICDGLTSTLSSSVTNTNYTYQWSDANGVIVGLLQLHIVLQFQVLIH